MHEWFHLSAWFAIPYLMHDRATHGTSFNPFEHLQFRATSCTLRGALFHIVACILMHEWFHLGAWFTPFEHLQFRATSCTLRGALFHIVACILMHEWFHLGAWFAIPYLMHDRTTHGTLFNPLEHLQFRVTSCTLRWFGGCRAVDFLSVVWVFEGNKMMWYSESGAPNRTWTCDQSIMSRLLWPTELWGRKKHCGL